MSSVDGGGLQALQSRPTSEPRTPLGARTGFCFLSFYVLVSRGARTGFFFIAFQVFWHNNLEQVAIFFSNVMFWNMKVPEKISTICKSIVI